MTGLNALKNMLIRTGHVRVLSPVLDNLSEIIGTVCDSRRDEQHTVECSL